MNLQYFIHSCFIIEGAVSADSCPSRDVQMSSRREAAHHVLLVGTDYKLRAPQAYCDGVFDHIASFESDEALVFKCCLSPGPPALRSCGASPLAF